MRNLLVLFTLLILSTPAWSQSTGVPETYINHAWVQGVYWNPDELPSWGFFVDVQEETMFGAIYGYMGSDATFIVLQGNNTSIDPLTYRGDVFFVSNGGSTSTDVGSFTWVVSGFEASPAARLTLTSNILDVNNLALIRFSYVEIDKVDMISGGDWNIVRRVLGVTFGDHYDITDERSVDDGITFALVRDNSVLNKIGVIAYFPPDQGDNYAMLIEFIDDTNVFYVFVASDTDMYGRYWLLEEGENPTGNGSYFHGSADTLQRSSSGGGVTSIPDDAPQSVSESSSRPNANSLSDMKRLEQLEYDNADEQLRPMFSEATVQDVYQTMIGKYLSNKDHLR